MIQEPASHRLHLEVFLWPIPTEYTDSVTASYFKDWIMERHIDKWSSEKMTYPYPTKIHFVSKTTSLFWKLAESMETVNGNQCKIISGSSCNHYTVRLVKCRQKILLWFFGFIGNDIFWNFENWSTRTLRKCVSFLPPSVGRNVVVTVCTGTDSQPVTACRLKLISAGF